MRRCAPHHPGPVLGAGACRYTGQWLLVVMLLIVLPWARVYAASPQPYKIDFQSTNNDALDSAIKATSQLQQLRSSEPEDPFALIARARGDLERLQTVLESFGYYDGSVNVTINGHALDDPDLGDVLLALPKGTSAQIKVVLALGPLFHIGKIDIEGTLPADARAALGLATGAPAIAADVLAGGSRVLQTLQDEGYAFAQVPPPVAHMDPQARVLNLEFKVTTGPHVNVGEIKITGLKRLRERFVRRRLLLHTGELYNAAQVEKARKDLLSLGLFGSVTVQLGNAPDPEGRVPITFDIRERAPRTVGVNAAYSSDLGGSGGVSWTNRNLLGDGEQLTIATNVINVAGGTATTGLGYDGNIKYILPDVGHRDQSLQFAVQALKQNLTAYSQTAQSFGITLTRKISSVWNASIGVSDLRENIVQESLSSDFDLVQLPANLRYDTTDVANPLDDPLHGFRASLAVTPTLSLGANTDRSFVIMQASVAHYFDLHPLFGAAPGRSVIAVRALAGIAPGVSVSTYKVTPQVTPECYTTTPGTSPPPYAINLPDLPPDQRFYAGGSGTIRGYAYQSVGPQFPCDNNPIGGLSVMAVNLEWRRRIGENFGAAVFVDGGAVSQSINPLDKSCPAPAVIPGTLPAYGCGGSGVFRVGAGIGARYYTPIGPIRLDVAVPVDRRASEFPAQNVPPGVVEQRQTISSFEVYIGLGQAF
jgi:translocation and assembly module TamA